MKKFLVILGVLMLACLGTILFNVTDDIAFATDGTIQTDCSVITQTDTPNGINIHNYVNEFYQMTESHCLIDEAISSGTLFFNNCSSGDNSGTKVYFNARGDDNIVKIIPKAYFTYPNEKYTWSQEGKLEEFKSKIAEINLQGNNTYTYDDFGNTTYFKMEKGNCHFVFLAAQGYPKNGERAYISDEQVQWAYTQVYRLAKNYPNDPIFVFVHEPFYNTVGGSIKQYMDNDSTLRWYLNKFPTVTVFTSHSHDDINSSNWVYQEQKASAGSGIGMTLFNTASVGDVWKNNQDYGSQTDSQGLHVDVYDDSIVVRARDFANKRWIKEYKIDLNAKRASLANSNIG